MYSNSACQYAWATTVPPLGAAAPTYGEIPLKLAKKIADQVKSLWKSGDFQQRVSSITQDLLKFWDPNGVFSNERSVNFNEGQWQSILNVVYVHEILKLSSVRDMYHHVEPELLTQMSLSELRQGRYEHPMYCVKMATGTGKTWVLDALLIWQYLNSKYEENASGLYSKNFLLIAPGIIVYERLLDAFLGKRKQDGDREFELSDFTKFEKLFIPPAYKEVVFGFIKSSVAQK